MAITHNTDVRNSLAEVVGDAVDAGSAAGTLEFQTSGDVEVATLTFSDPSFGSPSNGIITAASITEDSNATGGIIAKFRIFDSDSNEVIEGTVTETDSGGDIELSSVSVGSGDTVSISSLTYEASE